MKNYKQPGKVLTMVAPSGGVVSGLVYVFGKIFGVAAVTAAEGEGFELATGEVFGLPKKSADTFAVGADVYWDATAKECTSTTTGNTKIGVTLMAEGAGVTEMDVRLNSDF